MFGVSTLQDLSGARVIFLLPFFLWLAERVGNAGQDSGLDTWHNLCINNT
jgi:hypothetical protein